MVGKDDGPGSSPAAMLSRRAICVAAGAPFLLVKAQSAPYWPEPDAGAGWRRPGSPGQCRREAGLDPERLAEAFEYVRSSSKNGGLLVARRGWLALEGYFGRGHAEATPNAASVGKSFTSLAMGILLGEQASRFPEGLNQRVMTRDYFPAAMFPLSDPRKSEIRLGQLLAMTAGIRGNNPGYVFGEQQTLQPEGPDGWEACRDDMAFGRAPGGRNAQTLWCEPGGGYSYATSSIHLVSVLVRTLAGMELEEFVRRRMAAPMGWGRWGWGYRNRPLRHTPGGGGIALRPRDMLRTGYLLLRGGRWKGTPVVPESYVKQAGTASEFNPHFPYSLQFNVNSTGAMPGAPADLFWKTGSGGFCLYVIPSLDLVVYKMAGRDDQYTRANTGLPEPEGIRPRTDWTEPEPRPEEAYPETLRLVLSAVI